jgi:hypothetical protein
MNAGPADFYARNPCYIGYAFLRIEVSGEARVCCIAKHTIGMLEKEGGWRAVWRSAAYEAFRAKMLRIHHEKFHLKDPEYYFCQQCSNLYTNWRFNRAASGEE